MPRPTLAEVDDLRAELAMYQAAIEKFLNAMDAALAVLAEECGVGRDGKREIEAVNEERCQL